MAFLNCCFKSALLGKAVNLNAVIPQCRWSREYRYGEAENRRYPVIFLLHGLSDDYSAWMRYTSIERYANEYNAAVIMPDGGRSFYTDAANGFPYWSFISEELPAGAAVMFPISLMREDCCAAGLSMGGYGALKLALRHPERFAAAAALSPFVDLERRFNAPESASWRREFENIFVSPDEAKKNANDLFTLAQNALLPGEMLPRLISFCGVDDFMIEDNRKFNAFMKELDYPEFYSFEYSGSHNWKFWDTHIQDVFRLFFDHRVPEN